MAYLVGMLANSMPIPGGFFAVEGGLVGMLLLFGVHPGSLVLAAVVTYRAISLWIPALIGTAAFAGLRARNRRAATAPARARGGRLGRLAPVRSGNLALRFAEEGPVRRERRGGALAGAVGEVVHRVLHLHRLGPRESGAVHR